MVSNEYTVTRRAKGISLLRNVWIDAWCTNGRFVKFLLSRLVKESLALSRRFDAHWTSIGVPGRRDPRDFTYLAPQALQPLVVPATSRDSS